MPNAVSDGPSVSLSFANNFWGRDDAGVAPLLERLANAKQTCDELKSFYNARAALEDEYSRKLLSLSRKPLGSQETGTLRASLDVMRGEVEQMGKSHQYIGAQMKTELEEPLAAFAGAMKERRKIVQSSIEKLLKVKVQQTQHVNKTRDKYEQECLKIKGYLAQGHMVMGQEERKNKAKLEKTQVNVATANTEYEAAIKVLEETTGRWNRDWKAAADKFQDLEEERIDFTKSSLWSFANIASTVCVSDDASCEKIRLSLENCEVEKDIIFFIKERGTGQEIPDPPRYINFCRGDINDSQSEHSEDESYSVAQFQRTINPAYRSSSPQPSVYESHHDPKSSLARELGHREPNTPPSREATLTPQKAVVDKPRQTQPEYQREATRTHYDKPRQAQPEYQREATRALYDKPRQVHPEYQREATRSLYDKPRQTQPEYQREATRAQYDKPLPIQRTAVSQDLNRTEGNKKESNKPQYEQTQHNKRQLVSQEHFKIEGKMEPNRLQYEPAQHGPLASVPHDPYPMDGMTMLCRTGPPSGRSSAHSGARPSSRDSQSEYSNPTSFSSQDPPSGKQSPVKRDVVLSPVEEKQVQKRKSGFFQNHSPFRRKSKHEKDLQSVSAATANKPTFTVRGTTNKKNVQTRPPQKYFQNSRTNLITDRPSGSPEPVDPRASFQLNVGNNVFDVAAPEKSKRPGRDSLKQDRDESDPIAQALAELKGVTKQSSIRISADHYHGISTPAPGSSSATQPVPSPISNSALVAGLRGTPPPSYEQPVQRLGLPQPAFTSKAMQQTSQKYVTQTQNMFSTSQRPGSQAGYSSGPQSRPGPKPIDIPRALSPGIPRSVSPRPVVLADTRQAHRSPSPNPYASGQQRTYSQAPPQNRVADQTYYQHNSSNDIVRAISPLPLRDSSDRPSSSHTHSEMAIQLAPAPDEYGSSQRSRTSGPAASNRPMSLYNGPTQSQVVVSRERSRSIADGGQFTRDGRPILHFARAVYNYQAAIPEELGFAKGDVLAILTLQDDGWWEAEVTDGSGRVGLVPSNYVQNISQNI